MEVAGRAIRRRGGRSGSEAAALVGEGEGEVDEMYCTGGSLSL